jgi:NAD-dependent dihydropyrimidine dehydrogenase PreA subunit
MVKRQIIIIDEELCDGCGDCVIGCAEGALQIIDGKARMVRDDYCDGFGDCVGTCHAGAITIGEREVADYDPDAARVHVAKIRGQQGIEEFDRAAARHGQAHGQPPSGGCPGSQMRVFPRADGGVSPSSPNPSFVGGAPAPLPGATGSPAGGPAASSSQDPGTVIPPSLGQWPIQLHLVRPGAPFFKNRELSILSTCSPVAMPDAQWRFVRDRGVVMACPKLDRTEGYVEKLADIMAEPSIPRALVVRLEAPCCGGLSQLAVRAAARCGREDLSVVEVTVATDGRLIGERVLCGPGA